MARSGVLVQRDAVDAAQQLAIHGLHMAVVGQVLIYDSHLAAPYAGAYIAHAIVVAYLLVLVVGV